MTTSAISINTETEQVDCNDSILILLTWSDRLMVAKALNIKREYVKYKTQVRGYAGIAGSKDIS